MGEENETAPYLAGVEKKSGAYIFTTLDGKTSNYATAFLVGKVKEFGYKRMRFMSDNEASIKKLKGRVAENLPGVEIVPREAPEGDH